MRLLLASDIHCDLGACAALVEQAREADAVLLAGDFARQHKGLAETITALAPIAAPTILIPGNNETSAALLEACAGWDSATVLHGGAARLNDLTIFGLGGGIPPIGRDWSFDLEDDAAARLLAQCPAHVDILLVHSPPRGYVDVIAGRHLGSRAILDTIQSRRPRLAVCGHVHDCWEQESRLGPTTIINAGPRGRLVNLEPGPPA